MTDPEPRGSLCITLHSGQSFYLDDSRVTVQQMTPGKFRVHIDARKSVAIRREDAKNPNPK